MTVLEVLGRDRSRGAALVVAGFRGGRGEAGGWVRECGRQEVVCHNDLSPKNTVYSEDGSRAIAFIDWDIAAPGPRIHDLAFICWQYAEPGTPDHVAN